MVGGGVWGTQCNPQQSHIVLYFKMLVHKYEKNYPNNIPKKIKFSHNSDKDQKTAHFYVYDECTSVCYTIQNAIIFPHNHVIILLVNLL